MSLTRSAVLAPGGSSHNWTKCRHGLGDREEIYHPLYFRQYFLSADFSGMRLNESSGLSEFYLRATGTLFPKRYIIKDYST